MYAVVMTASMGAVIQEKTFKVYIKQIGFNIEDYASTEEAKLVVNSGPCAGRSFNIKKNSCKLYGEYDMTVNPPVYRIAGWSLECFRSLDESISQYFPNNIFTINEEDEFVLTGLEMPDLYVQMASQKLYDEAVEDLNRAIELDTTNTFAYFNRALLLYERHDYNGAMADFNTVLRHEPGNALTLYNRSLIYTQVGDYEKALEDIDRVININPDNVLAHFNRAAIFVEMERWMDALADYNKAIELYPDFAKAYLNRSYVENMLGRTRESKADYETAQQKVREYMENSKEASYADTTRKYDSLLAFDGDFAQEEFNNELLQHRDVDIQLRPLYRFGLLPKKENRSVALSRRYENALIDRFIDQSPLPMGISNGQTRGDGSLIFTSTAEECFVKGLQELQDKRFTSALEWFDKAVQTAGDDVERDKYANYYKAFYLMNRGVLKAEMIDFIASLEGNVQTLSMDANSTTRARVSDHVARSYDYSDAIADIRAALEILPDIPYLYFNLGNLLCLSSQFVEAIENYDMSIKLYPYMGDAYFNRGLVLIYLRDSEKGCIDLSRAGELGVEDAYSVISKYCENEGD